MCSDMFRSLAKQCTSQTILKYFTHFFASGLAYDLQTLARVSKKSPPCIHLAIICLKMLISKRHALHFIQEAFDYIMGYAICQCYYYTRIYFESVVFPHMASSPELPYTKYS